MPPYRSGRALNRRHAARREAPRRGSHHHNRKPPNSRGRKGSKVSQTEKRLKTVTLWDAAISAVLGEVKLLIDVVDSGTNPIQ